MEGNKKIGSSSSSCFTSELFGSKETSGASSSGSFGSIFANPSKTLVYFETYVVGHKVMGRDSFNSETVRPSEDWNKKNGNGAPSDFLRTGNQSVPRDSSSFNQESRVENPCNLSSSILYGGRDIYSRPPNSQNSAAHSTFKNDGGEDDTATASRGNWWQGSLYY